MKQNSYITENHSPARILDRSLAFSTVNALCTATGLDWKLVFNALIHHACTLALMPNDIACVKATLSLFFRHE